jgi:uncharacterized protein YozE (UPF0346 family)
VRVGATFYAWVRSQRGRDDAVGDLARDVMRDRNFPREANDYDALYFHLYEMGACPAALRAFDRAWEEFQRARRGSTMTLLAPAPSHAQAAR